MTEAATHLLAELNKLSTKERAEIAYELIRTLDPETDDNVEEAWEAEVARRVEEIRSGRAKGKPAEQLFAELRAETS